MLNAYYEEDEEVVKDLNGKNSTITNSSINAILNRIEKKKFKEEVNIDQLINIVIWYGEGYIKEKYRKSHIDIDEIEKDYENIIDFFRKGSYKEEYLP
jgi:TetR/AcrR family transcriptional regulator